MTTTTADSNVTDSAPDYHIILATLRWDYAQNRWRRAMLLPLNGNDEFFPAAHDVPLLSARQLERAPWKFHTYLGGMSEILRNDFSRRRIGVAANYGSDTPFGEGEHGTHMMRMHFVPVDHDDFVAMQTHSAPSHRTRKIFKDWEAELARKHPSVIATP